MHFVLKFLSLILPALGLLATVHLLIQIPQSYLLTGPNIWWSNNLLWVVFAILCLGLVFSFVSFQSKAWSFIKNSVILIANFVGGKISTLFFALAKIEKDELDSLPIHFPFGLPDYHLTRIWSSSELKIILMRKLSSLQLSISETEIESLIVQANGSKQSLENLVQKWIELALTPVSEPVISWKEKMAGALSSYVNSGINLILDNPKTSLSILMAAVGIGFYIWKKASSDGSSDFPGNMTGEAPINRSVGDGSATTSVGLVKPESLNSSNWLGTAHHSNDLTLLFQQWIKGPLISLFAYLGFQEAQELVSQGVESNAIQTDSEPQEEVDPMLKQFATYYVMTPLEARTYIATCNSLRSDMILMGMSSEQIQAYFDSEDYQEYLESQRAFKAALIERCVNLRYNHKQFNWFNLEEPSYEKPFDLYETPHGIRMHESLRSDITHPVEGYLDKETLKKWEDYKFLYQYRVLEDFNEEASKMAHNFDYKGVCKVDHLSEEDMNNFAPYKAWLAKLQHKNET